MNLCILNKCPHSWPTIAMRCAKGDPNDVRLLAQFLLHYGDQ